MKTRCVEGVNEDMERITKAKFKEWDRVVKEDLLEKGNETDKAYVYRLLNDPTVYAYAFFKDKKNKAFEAYSYQDMILNDPAGNTEGMGRIIFVAANQIGKSVTLCLHALHRALNNPGKTFLMVSKTLPQSKDLLRQIKFFLRSSDMDYKFDIGDTETRTEIYFKHYEEYEEYDKELDKMFTKVRELPQSRIICVPATEAALGYPVDGLYLDELAFFEDGDYFYKQIAQPRTYHTKGYIIVFSNPNGQQGIFWELWNNRRFCKYKFDFLDCPDNTQKEFDINSEDLTRDQIDSTLLAVFTNPEGGFISLNERRNMQEERMNALPSLITEPVYIFFDFAKARDRTVRTIGIPIKSGDRNGVYVYEMKEYPQKTPYNLIVNELEELIKNIGFSSIAMVGWDNTGVGKGIEDFIRKIEDLGVVCTPVDFNLANKSAIYTLFKLLVEKNVRGEIGIKIPKIKECDKQLSTLRFNKTNRGYLQVHHMREADRDDFPDALAGLCSLIIQPESAPVTVELITEEKKYNPEIDVTRCPDCDNIIDAWDTECSFCGRKVDFDGII